MCRISETTEAAISLWNIGADFDDIHFQLNNILNTIYIFEEQLDSEVEFLKRCDDAYAKHFIQRYDMIKSLLDVIRSYTCDTLNDMRMKIDAVYEADKKINPRIKE